MKIIVDTKLQPNNSLHSSSQDLLVTKEQFKGISSFDFGTCRSVEK